jgi:hypothetical protein
VKQKLEKGLKTVADGHIVPQEEAKKPGRNKPIRATARIGVSGTSLRNVYEIT